MTTPVAGRRYDAALHLLDRQIVDTDGRLLGKVDDLEFAVDEAGTVRLVAILTGPGALGPRLGGRIGEWMVAVWRRLHRETEPEPRRLVMADVISIDSAVRAIRGIKQAELETWLDEFVVRRIPGAGHDPE